MYTENKEPETTQNTAPALDLSRCYQQLFISLYNEDCIETMKRISDSSVDLLLQDTPYNVTDCEWDKPINLLELWPEWERIVKPNGAIVFFSQQPCFYIAVVSASYLYSF